MPLWMTSPKKQAKLRALRRWVRVQSEELCLDIGHGSGAVHRQLAAAGGAWFCTTVTACDEDRGTRPGDWVSLLAGSRDLPFVSQCFDTICAVDALEHLEDDEAFVRELHRTLQNRGLLYVTVPRVDGSLLLRNWHVRRDLARNHHRHVREGYTETEIRVLLERFGFRVLFTQTFSGLFTEILDGICCVLLRRLLGRRARAGVPRWATDLRAHPMASVLYCLAQPFLVALRGLDAMFPGQSYGLLVAAQKMQKRQVRATLKRY
jgi:SAM-dependent methyltransferase